MTNFTLIPEFVFSRIAGGNAYFVSKILTVPGNGSASIHIRNPHGDKDMWLAAIDVIATGDQEVWMHDWFDSMDAGTEIVIQNALLDSEGGAPDSGPFEAYYDSTFTTATDGKVPVGITEASNPTVNTISYFPTVVEPGREVVLELQETSGSQEKALISVLLVTSY